MVDCISMVRPRRTHIHPSKTLSFRPQCMDQIVTSDPAMCMYRHKRQIIFSVHCNSKAKVISCLEDERREADRVFGSTVAE